MERAIRNLPLALARKLPLALARKLPLALALTPNPNPMREQVEERLRFYDTGEAPRKNVDCMKEVMHELPEP